MDLNYLFHRQQVERMRAADASTPEVEQAHAEMARRYERTIVDMTEGDLQFAEAPQDDDA